MVAEALAIWLGLSGIERVAEGNWKGSLAAVNATMRALGVERTDAQLGLLEAAVRDYLQEAKISLLEASEGAKEELGRAREALGFFGRSEVSERTQSIEVWARGALEHYQLVANKLERGVLWELYAEAEEMSKSLQAHRLGASEEKAEAPAAAATWLYICKDLGQLVEQASNLPQGVMLVLVETSERLNSYFLFLVHDGERLVAFSDEENWQHPLEHKMTRRVERRMERRAEKGGLPYQLVAPEMYQQTESESTELAPEGARQFYRLNDLPTDQALFILLCYDALALRYRNIKEMERSYVSAKTTASLGEGASNLALRRGDLEIAAPRLEDLVAASAEAKIESHGLNAALINEFLASETPKEATALEVHEYALAQAGGGLRSESQLRADVAWLGREKLARQITTWAEKRYGREERASMEWLAVAGWAARAKLLSWVGQEVMDSELKVKSFGEERGLTHKRPLWVREKGKVSWRMTGDTTVVLSKEGGFITRWWNGNPTCAITGASTIAMTVTFTPRCGKDLAKLLGIEEAALPSVLRERWQSERSYIGNEILDRLDPLDWALRDPWGEKPIEIVVFLSKKGLKSLGVSEPKSES